MNKFKFVFCSILFLLNIYCCSTTQCQTVQVLSSAPSPKEYSRYLQNYLPSLDPVWDTTHTYFYEGAFVGNGLLGAMVYRNDDNSLRWDINRADLTAPSNNPEYLRARFGLGKIVMRPEGKIINSSMRIDIWNGVLKGNIITAKGKVQFESFVHPNLNVIVTSIETINEKVSYTFEPEPAKVILKYAWQEKDGTFEYPTAKIIEQVQTNACKLYRQIFEKEKSYFEIAIKNKIEKQKHFYFTTINTNVPFATDTTNSTKTLAKLNNLSYQKIKYTHQNWWNNFMQKNFVHLPDARLASFYWIQKYKIGSSFRENGPLLDLMGPWYAYTPWPAIWWNLNVQLTYSPLYALNLLEYGETLYKTLDNNISNLIQNAPEPYRHNAAGIGRVTTFDLKGEVNLLNSVFPYYDKEPGNLQWVMHNYFTQYLYAQDEQMLKERIFPLLKRSTNLYLNYIRKEKDGKYHIPETFSPEYALTKDANYDLSLLKWGCKTLIWIADRLSIKDDKYPLWKEVLENLIEYPTDENGLRIGKDTALATSHRHYSHLLMIYPLRLLNKDNPTERVLMQKSIDHWLKLKGGHAGYTYTGSAAMYAMMGKGDSSLKQLDIFLDQLPISTMYREAGPVIETPFAAITSTNEMLLQSYNGYIQVFPAMPRGWSNARFDNLRAEGAFLVSASRQNYLTTWIKIMSIKGQKCIIKLDFEPVYDTRISKVDESLFEVKLNKGEEIFIIPKNKNKATNQYTTNGKINYFGMKLYNQKSPKKYITK